MTRLPPTDSDRWYLLAQRPGWRQSEVLSSDVDLTDGRLRLAAGGPAPTVFDCPAPTCVAMPCCERAVLQPACRRVMIVTGTGQVRLVLGPYRYDADRGLTPTEVRCGIGDHQCTASPEWNAGTWQPAGLIAVGPGLGVIDPVARLVHVFDAAGAWVRSDDGADLTDACPWPDGTARFQRSGRFVSLALDSGLPECEWHRVVLRGSIPPGTRVAAATLATDADLGEAEVATLDPARWVPAGVFSDPYLDVWDALIVAPKGRYLWLSLELGSDGAVTPELDDVEVHFPRRTSLRYLPAVFRSGDDGGSFLDRYLALTDTMRASVTAELDHLSWVLDARSAPASADQDFLGWLGGWVGMTGTAQLPPPRRRALVGHAAELYRRRGTPDGVTRLVGMWLGRRTQVVEHYRMRRWAVLSQGRLGDATRLFGPQIVRRLQLDEYATIGAFQLVDTPSPRLDPFGVYAHRFTLFVHAREGDDPEQLAATAARVVASAQPAHTSSAVAVVLPRMRVGVQASLGLDSVVAGPPPPSRLGEDRLGAGPVVVARDPARGDRPAVGIDARVGTRAVIV